MKLTAENYFSKEAEQFYMGSTQFKRFMQCEACAMAYIRGEYEQPKSTALLVGSYVEAHSQTSWIYSKHKRQKYLQELAI